MYPKVDIGRVMDPGEMIKIKRIKGDMKGLGAVTMPDRNVIGCVRKAIPLDSRIQKQTHFDTFFEKKSPAHGAPLTFSFGKTYSACGNAIPKTTLSDLTDADPAKCVNMTMDSQATIFVISL